MTYKKYSSANNAHATLSTDISDSDTTFILSGYYDRLSESNFILKLTHIEDGIVMKRENVFVTTRVGDTCGGVIRAYEPVPISDMATESIQQALNFSALDVVEEVVSSEFLLDIQEEVSKKLYTDGGLRIGFGTDKTVVVNRATGEEEVKDVSDGTVIEPNDKIRLQKADGSFEDFEMEVFGKGYQSTMSFVSEYFPIRDLSERDVIFEYNHPTINQAIASYLNVGDTTGIVTLAKRISSGTSGNTITIKTDKVSPTANFGIRIVTCDSSGNPTTTLVDANAVQYVAPASVASGGGNTVVTFPGSFTCGAEGSVVAIQVCQGTFSTPVINNAAYYKVGMSVGITDLSSEVTARGDMTGPSIGSGTYNINMTLTASRRCSITQFNFGNAASAGMVFTLTSSGRTYSQTLASDSNTLILDAPFSVEQGQTVILSNYGNWTGWRSSPVTNVSSADITITTLTQGPLYVEIKTTYELDLPCTLSMTGTGYVEKSRANDIITQYYTGFCLANVTKGFKPLISTGYISGFIGLSRLPYYVGTTPGGISTSQNTSPVGFGETKTILKTKSDLPFRLSGVPRVLVGDIFFPGGTFRYLLSTASSSATLQWTGDIVNPSFVTLETLGASSSVDRTLCIPKGYLRLTHTGTLSTNQFHF